MFAYRDGREKKREGREIEAYAFRSSGTPVNNTDCQRDK